MVSDSVKKILEAEKNGEQKTVYAEKKAEEIIGKANLSAKEILQNARDEAAKEAEAIRPIVLMISKKRPLGGTSRRLRRLSKP